MSTLTRTPPRLLVAVCALLGAQALLPGCGDTYYTPSPRAAAEPPLRRIAYAESPEYTPARAQEVESSMLDHYRKTGALPPPEDPDAPKPDPAEPDALVIPDNIIDQDIDPELIERAREEGGAAIPVDSQALAGNAPDPVALGRAIFDALTRQDAEVFDRLLVTSEDLQDLQKVKAETGDATAANLRRGAMQAFKVFAPGVSSMELDGGLGPHVRFDSVRLGRGLTLRGRKVRDPSDAQQYWDSVLLFRFAPPGDARDTADPIKGTRAEPMLFAMTLPHLLKTASGGWKLARIPKFSIDFRTFLKAGMHLKPELMRPEHHPMPLSVGNYWRYRVRRPDRGLTDVFGVTDLAKEEIRVEVTDVRRYPGYRVASLRRTHSVTPEETSSTRFHYLVTPRFVFRCTSYCRSKANSPEYVLAYIRDNTPALIFPLEPGMGWERGGELTRNDSRYETLEKLHTAQVPAGEFRDTVVIETQIRAGIDARYFKPGLGYVKRDWRGNTGSRFEELVRYRILNTE